METASSWSGVLAGVLAGVLVGALAGTMGGDSTEQAPCLSTTAVRDVINSLHCPAPLCRPPRPHTCQGIHSVSHRSQVTMFVARSEAVHGSRAGELLRQLAGRGRQQRGNRHRCRHRRTSAAHPSIAEQRALGSHFAHGTPTLRGRRFLQGKCIL